MFLKKVYEKVRILLRTEKYFVWMIKKNSSYALICQGTKKYYMINSSSWPVTLPDENTYKETYFSTTSSITPKISSPSSR